MPDAMDVPRLEGWLLAPEAAVVLGTTRQNVNKMIRSGLFDRFLEEHPELAQRSPSAQFLAEPRAVYRLGEDTPRAIYVISDSVIRKFREFRDREAMERQQRREDQAARSQAVRDGKRRAREKEIAHSD